MATTIDQALMWAATFALAYGGHRLWRYFFPELSAEELGYAPGSETPPWGWPIALALGLAAFGLLLFGPTMAARMIGI